MIEESLEEDYEFFGVVEINFGSLFLKNNNNNNNKE